MKKLSGIVAFLMALFMMGACSSNSPKAVVEKAMDCIMDKDFDGYVEFINITPKEGEDIAAQKKMLAGMLQDKYARSVEKKGGLKSYEIVSEEVAGDGKTAVVAIRVTYGDGEAKEDTIKMMKDDGGNWKMDAGK